MRKVVLSIAVVSMALFTAQAQDEAASSDWKPASGDVAIETVVQSPFASGSPFSLISGGLKVRYWLNDDMALRVGLNFTGNTNITNYKDSALVYGTGSVTDGNKNAVVEGSETVSSSAFTMSIGAEKHFDGSDRLDTYLGGDITFGFGSNTTDRVNYDGNTNTHANGYTSDTRAEYTYNSAQSNSSFGFKLVAGADYYVFKNVYVGIELGWAMNSTSYDTKKTSGKGFTQGTSDDFLNYTKEVDDNDTEVPGSSSSAMGAAMTTGAFRIGFRL